jgi:hypothetical protein
MWTKRQSIGPTFFCLERHDLCALLNSYAATVARLSNRDLYLRNHGDCLRKYNSPIVNHLVRGEPNCSMPLSIKQRCQSLSPPRSLWQASGIAPLGGSMSIPLDTLEAEVLKLPAGARSQLLDRLIASLEADAGIDGAWAVEAERRDREIDEGKASTVPGKELVERLRATLR